MAGVGNPHNTPPVAGRLLPTDLTTAIDTVFNSEFRLVGCPQSDVISQIFSHFSRLALHISHPLVHYRIPTTGLIAFPEPLPSQRHLTVAQRDSTLIALKKIIHHLDIKVGPLDTNVNGSTSPVPNRRFAEWPGCGSTITISITKVQELREAIRTSNLMLQQYYQFDIARLLLHEFAHSIGIAVLPRNRNAYFFLGDGPTTEIGFEYENRLFGGMINPDLSKFPTRSLDPWNYLPFMIVNASWPSVRTIEGYNARGPDYINIVARHNPVSRISTSWQVSFEWISQMFQDSFWREAFAGSFGDAPLVCERHVGMLGGATLDGRWQPVNPEDPAVWEHIPDRYILEMNGLVRRARVGELVFGV